MKLVIDISEEYYKTIKETKKEVVPIGWASIRDGIKHEERPQGKWILVKPYTFACSLCGRLEEHQEPFCNCGAKMEIRVGESE